MISSIKNNIFNIFSDFSPINFYSKLNKDQKIVAIALSIFSLYLTFCTCRYFYYLRKLTDGKHQTINFFGYVREGEFKNGKLNGEGRKEGLGLVAEGTFQDGRFVKGKMTFTCDFLNLDSLLPKILKPTRPNREVLEGEFKDGYLIKGKYTWEGVYVAKGNFKGDYLNGKGKITYEADKVIKQEKGEFKDSKLDGKGKRIYMDGMIEEGEFKTKSTWFGRAHLHGVGKRIYTDGKVEEGKFEYGKFIG